MNKCSRILINITISGALLLGTAYALTEHEGESWVIGWSNSGYDYLL